MRNKPPPKKKKRWLKPRDIIFVNVSVSLCVCMCICATFSSSMHHSLRPSCVRGWVSVYLRARSNAKHRLLPHFFSSPSCSPGFPLTLSLPHDVIQASGTSSLRVRARQVRVTTRGETRVGQGPNGERSTGSTSESSGEPERRGKRSATAGNP